MVLAIKQVDEKLNFEDIANIEDNEKYHLLQLYRETMLKGFNFGFEVWVNYFKKIFVLQMNRENIFVSKVVCPSYTVVPFL